jgi:two-component system LytT family sensor kinase
VKQRNFYIADNRALTHIVFWVALLLMNTLIYGAYEDKYWRQFQIEIADLPIKIALAYVNLYVLIPAFLNKRKYTAYVLSVLLCLLISAIYARALNKYYLAPKFFPNDASVPFWNLYRILKVMWWSYQPIIFLTTGIRMFKNWYDQQQTNTTLHQQKLKAELDYLRAQVHPHFLFNTLNNLYALTLTKSETAPQVVLKLSELMSYMLYDSQTEQVALSKEITHIKNYLELERLRYGNRLDLSFNVSGEAGAYQIAPLLLIPFVENAFKHGVSNQTEGAWITIDIKIKDDILYFKTENSKAEFLPVQDTQNYKKGIGLQNVRRRLELLYNNKHSLEVIDERRTFSVDLKLHLN